MKKKKITIVMPGYNAAKTLESTYHAIPKGSYDKLIQNAKSATFKNKQSV